MKKIKLKIKITPQKILKYYYILLLLGLVFAGYKIYGFLNKNVYQAIFWSGDELGPSQVYTVEEDVNIKQFDDIIRSIEQKTVRNEFDNRKNLFSQ